MKDKTGGIAIEIYFGLKPKMYLFLVDNSKHQKSKRREEKKLSKQ